MKTIFKSRYHLSVFLFFHFPYTIAMKEKPQYRQSKPIKIKTKAYSTSQIHTMYNQSSPTNFTDSFRTGFYALQKHYDSEVRCAYITNNNNQELYTHVLTAIKNAESLDDLKEILCQTDYLDKIYNRGKYTNLTICECLKDSKNFSIHSISQDTIYLLMQLIKINQPHDIINPVIKTILDRFLNLYTQELQKEKNGIEGIMKEKNLSNSSNDVV